VVTAVLGLLFAAAVASSTFEVSEAGPWDSGFWQATGLTLANAQSTASTARTQATGTAAAYGTAIAAVPTRIWTVQQVIVDMQATATTAALRSESALSQATRDAAQSQTNNAFSTRAALYQTATAIPATATPVPPTATAANALGHLGIAAADHQVATVQLGNYRGTATAVAATAAAMIANAQATLPPAEAMVQQTAVAATATAVEVARIIGSLPPVGQPGAAPTAVPAPPPAAPPPLTGSLAAGQVLQLSGTPHLWFVDSFGVLHWGGDTRAIAGREINWSSTRGVSLPELVSRPIGDPWLSAGLVKIGDPIYLVKWEANQATPILLHVQSITDVQIFGINSTNYGSFVYDAAEWEQRFGFSLASLVRATLPRAT